jgi:hypothetical protein
MSLVLKIDPNTPLASCPEVPVGTNLPGPINERLDLLITRANEHGARTTRKEALAALILAAPEERQRLFDLIVAFRRANAGSAGLRDSDPGQVLEFRRHPRGPRKRAIGA